MLKIMADNDVIGQLDAIREFLQTATWKPHWDKLQISVETFAGLGLPPDAPDVLVWQTCQEHEVVLFTGNRNNKAPDSLEEAIRTLNDLDCLPVVTLGNPGRFRNDPAYAEKAAIKLLEYLTDLNQYRGAGRIYVP